MSTHVTDSTDGSDGTDGTESARVVLYARAGCHLCDAARPVVAEIADAAGVRWVERDVDADADARARYGELVPAVTVDGDLVDYWRVDPARLQRALG